MKHFKLEIYLSESNRFIVEIILLMMLINAIIKFRTIFDSLNIDCEIFIVQQNYPSSDFTQEDNAQKVLW